MFAHTIPFIIREVLNSKNMSARQQHRLKRPHSPVRNHTEPVSILFNNADLQNVIKKIKTISFVPFYN